MKLHVLVVIYNLKMADSPSLAICRAYQHSCDLEIIVCDNSEPTLTTNGPLPGIRYVKMAGNQGISQAFKKVELLNDSHSENDWFVFFDQDTRFDEGYFEEVKRIAKAAKGCNAVFPTVYDSKGLLSPCRLGFMVAKRIDSSRRLPSGISNISFINSGMAIRGDVFKRVTFEGRLFLDYVDHQFVKDYKKQFGVDRLQISKSVLYQDFSSSSRQSEFVRRRRYSIFFSDFQLFQKLAGRPFWLALCYLLARAVHLCILHHTIVFLLDYNRCASRYFFSRKSRTDRANRNP